MLIRESTGKKTFFEGVGEINHPLGKPEEPLKVILDC